MQSGGIILATNNGFSCMYLRGKIKNNNSYGEYDDNNKFVRNI